MTTSILSSFCLWSVLFMFLSVVVVVVDAASTFKNMMFWNWSQLDWSRWWNVWSSRIIATVVILVVYDYLYERPKRQALAALYGRRQDSLQSQPQPTLRYEEIPETPSSRLVDSQQPKQQEQEEPIPDVTLEERQEPATKSTTPTNKTKQPTKEASSSPAPSNNNNNATPPATTTTMIQGMTNHHPGMEAFWYWYEIETSLFRIYTLGRHDGVEVVPPYVPHSHRGNVSLFLHVTNATLKVIKVYWVDYKGKYIQKGTIRPNHVWTQTTWIDHPWVFMGEEEEEGDEEKKEVPYLYYVPYRVIPTIPEVPTMTEDGIGRHQFRIVSVTKPTDPHYVGIDDQVLPFPASSAFADYTPALSWTLKHMARMNHPSPEDPTLDTLQKYLNNICKEPENPKYRQLRIRSAKFGPIWASPLKGLLLAIGFSEVNGFAEIGCATKPLSRDRIQQLALLSYLLNEWKHKYSQQQPQQQPEGADGFGRAGFGRAGHIN